MTNYTLYGAPVSLFSGKARAYLRWRGVKFEEVLTTIDVMREIVPQIGWPVIPVMRGKDGTLVQDTADIIAHVETEQVAQNVAHTSVYPQNPLVNFVSELFHVYGDEWLVLPAMHYRWNHNEDWTYSEFGRMAAPEADAQTQIEIGKKRGQMFKGFVPMLGITDETRDCIEWSYEAFLDEFSAHLSTHNFLLGGRPCLADFAFYGPLYAHLYRDPASGELMKTRAPKVAAWVERLRVGDYGVEEIVNELPQTLLPLLRRHFREHLPVLLATNKLLGDWADGQDSGAEPPRAFGMTSFEIGGCQGKIIARPFSLYRLQAALDIYASLNSEDKAQADVLLKATGGEALIDFKIAARLTRRNYKLVLA
jgi:glutathione S-transferase